MKFEINFNQHKEQDDKVLEELGAISKPTGSNKYPPFDFYEIELNTFEELEQLLLKTDYLTGRKYHDAVIGFDPACIFLDTDI